MIVLIYSKCCSLLDNVGGNQLIFIKYIFCGKRYILTSVVETFYKAGELLDTAMRNHRDTNY